MAPTKIFMPHMAFSKVPLPIYREVSVPTNLKRRFYLLLFLPPIRRTAHARLGSLARAGHGRRPWRIMAAGCGQGDLPSSRAILSRCRSPRPRHAPRPGASPRPRGDADCGGGASRGGRTGEPARSPPARPGASPGP